MENLDIEEYSYIQIHTEACWVPTPEPGTFGSLNLLSHIEGGGWNQPISFTFPLKTAYKPTTYNPKNHQTALSIVPASGRIKSWSWDRQYANLDACSKQALTHLPQCGIYYHIDTGMCWWAWMAQSLYWLSFLYLRLLQWFHSTQLDH